jgi:hypothetical protein
MRLYRVGVNAIADKLNCGHITILTVVPRSTLRVLCGASIASHLLNGI